MKKILVKENSDIWLSIFRVLIILILFFAIFFRIEIVQWFKENQENNEIKKQENIKTLNQENNEIKKQENIKILEQKNIKNQNTNLMCGGSTSKCGGQTLENKPEIKKEIKTKTSKILKPEVPKISESEISGDNDLSRGSFTDLFSGGGWVNSKTSTVYQDFKTTTISFHPNYQWEEIKNFNQLLKNKKIFIAKSNGKEIVLISKQGEIIIFRDEKQLSLKTIENLKEEPQTILLDYDKSSKKWIAVFVLKNKIFVYNFSDIKSSEKINLRELKIKLNSQDDLELSCLQGKCLITNGKELWKFDEQTLKSQSVKFDKIKSDDVLSIGKTDKLWLLGIVEKDGERYKGNVYQFIDNNWQIISKNQNPFFSSKYSGNIYFSYNSEGQEILIVYAGYEGQAYKFSINNDQFSIQNFSRFFPIRVMEGGMKPEIFYQNKVWWVGSSSKSPVSKFLRISSGIGNDFTPVLLDNISSFQLVSGFKEHQVYGIAFDGGSSHVYRFIDQGFQKKDKVVWESLKINSGDNKIIKGSLVEKEDGEESGRIQYSLTNNGGKNWVKTEPNKMIKFKTVGSDFRWKVEFYPSPDPFRSPWATRVMVDYYQVRD